MNGKEKCRILKDIRRSIAQANGIEYVTEECKHKGECRGTCPRCESEVAYLERELERRRSIGRSVAVAGLAVGIGMSMSGCADISFDEVCFDTGTQSTARASKDSGSRQTEKGTEEHIEIDGEIAVDGDIDIAGMIPLPPESSDTSDTTYVDVSPMGDIAILPIPEIDKVLDMGTLELESSIVYRTRDELREKWGEHIIAQSHDNREDIFSVSPDGTATLTVAYDANGYVSSYSINRTGQMTRDELQ